MNRRIKRLPLAEIAWKTDYFLFPPALALLQQGGSPLTHHHITLHPLADMVKYRTIIRSFMGKAKTIIAEKAGR